MTLAHNLYIHVPFCRSKCAYCAFYSLAVRPDWELYADGICHEIDDWAEKLGKISIPTIFFGGGTPSLMPAIILDRILTHLRTQFNITPDCEISLESNPGTMDHARLRDFIDLGINRLSIGVQSFNDHDLEFLGRRHNAADARRLIDDALDMGLRVSADFIYGLPNQTTHDIRDLCHTINQTGLHHCSLYELTIEPGTPLGKMNLNMPSNDTMADMYQTIGDTLNLPRYEVSNYATPGNECRHNMNVWDGAPYIGLGRGAAGRVWFNDTWYDQMGAGMRCDPIDARTRAIEKIITGLRTTRGVLLTPDVRATLNWDAINATPDLVQITADNRLRVTNKGILLLDNLLINWTV